MTATRTATCPSCNTLLADEDRVCAHCGAVMNVWSVTPQAPLILPGNPALSDDDTTNGSSAIRRVSVALAAIAVVGGITFAFTREPAARETTVATTAPSETETADSASAMSSGVVATEAELARARAARDSATADSARAAKRAVAGLPSTPSAAPAPSADALTRSPRVAIASSAPPIPAPKPTAAVVAAPVVAAPAVTARSTPIMPAPTPPKPAAPLVAARTTAVVTAPANVAAASPQLRMAPLVSSVLRAGDNLRLRGSVQDRFTGRELSAPIRFSSSNPRLARVDGRTGIVRGVAPGRVKITADAGSAGRMAVNLSVVPRGRTVAIAPATPKVVVPPKPPATSAAKPVAATTASARPAAVAPAVVAPQISKPAMSAPATSVASAPTAVTPAPLREVQRPDANEIRVAADRFVGDVKSGLRRNDELRQFFGDGADHRAALLGAPSAISETATGVRATFDMRLSKFDAAGRPLTRIAPVTIDIVKREGALNTSAVAIGALRKP